MNERSLFSSLKRNLNSRKSGWQANINLAFLVKLRCNKMTSSVLYLGFYDSALDSSHLRGLIINSPKRDSTNALSLEWCSLLTLSWVMDTKTVIRLVSWGHLQQPVTELDIFFILILFFFFTLDPFDFQPLKRIGHPLHLKDFWYSGNITLAEQWFSHVSA